MRWLRSLITAQLLGTMSSPVPSTLAGLVAGEGDAVVAACPVEFLGQEPGAGERE
jgi:hypothetical protein